MGLLIFTMIAVLLGGVLSATDSEQGRETDEGDDCGDEENRDGCTKSASALLKGESIGSSSISEGAVHSSLSNASNSEDFASVHLQNAQGGAEDSQLPAPGFEPAMEKVLWSEDCPSKAISTKSDDYSSESEIIYADAKEGESLVIDLPASVSGDVHRVDLNVHYRYEFGSVDRMEVSDVVRKYTVFLLGEEVPRAEYNVEIEELYDRSGSVVFSEDSFSGLKPFLVVNFGDIRETTFSTLGSLRPDATEPYDESDYTWIEAVEISSLVGDYTIHFNRCISSMHELTVFHKGEVNDY